jgi:hypothetical protein
MMQKLGTIFAALVVAGIALPSIASAESVVIGHGDRDRGARAEMREHHGWRDHGWRHHDKVVIIKRGHHHDHD